MVLVFRAKNFLQVTVNEKTPSFFLVGAGAFAYQLFVWKRMRDLILESGLPMVSRKEFNSVFGIFPLIASNFHRFYDLQVERLQSIYPAVLTVSVPFAFFEPHAWVSTADPAIVKHILKDRFDMYVKTAEVVQLVEDLVGNGIFGINHGSYSNDGGASWTLQRKTIAKVFSTHNFNTKMYTAFSNHAAIVSKVIDRKLDKEIDMQALMFQYTLDSIAEVGFGVELNSLNETLPFTEAFDRANELCMERFTRPLWFTALGRIAYSGERELKRHIKTMNDFLYGIIKQRREHPTDQLGNDILSLFLQEELALTDLELRDVLFSITIAGRDTTASVLSFALLMLAKHPEWQDLLFAEITTTRQEDQLTGDCFTAKQLSTMKQVQAVIMETLRLFPPVPTDSKEACEDDVLPGGYKIPKGTIVVFEPYIMARMPQLWGEDCLEFKPERWLHMETLPTSYEFPVFQAGPRICLGESMAKFEAQLMLAYLVERYTFSIPAGVDPESFTYSVGLTMRIKGSLSLEVKKRI